MAEAKAKHEVQPAASPHVMTALTVATGFAWTAALIVCFAVDWDFWWLLLVPIGLSMLAGQAERQAALTTTNVRWGIVGPGRIAAGVAKDFRPRPGCAGARGGQPLQSTGPRPSRPSTGSSGRTGPIRRSWPIPRWMRSTSPRPHPQHLQLALAAIAAGKAVLVEKTFTATVAGAEQLIAAARTAGVFAMEAMWTRFQPAIVEARRLIDDGAIGEVRQVQADLGVDRPYDPTDRLFDPAQGGGALLDLGVYVVSFAQYFLGDPDRFEVVGSLAPTGVDAEAGLLLAYADGQGRLAADLAARGEPGRRPDPGHRPAGSRCRRASTTRTGSC